MKKAVVLWLIYRKLRPALGVSFAFVLMSGVYFGILDLHLILAALGFFFIELFGAFYNDYWDFSEDIGNRREDKFTTCSLVSPKSCLYLSFMLASMAFLFLLLTAPPFLIAGVPYLILGFLYSHRKVRLKGKFIGYAVLSSPFLFLPFLIAQMNGASLLSTIPLSAFLFFQYLYLLCQKDSTDQKDRNNVFIEHGWEKTSRIILFFGLLSSLSLLYLCLVISPVLILLWVFNASLKFLNIYHIMNKVVTRTRRSRIILLEYATPYIYLAGGIL